MPVFISVKILLDTATIFARQPQNTSPFSKTEYEESGHSHNQDDEFIQKSKFRIFKRFFLFPINRKSSFFLSLALYIGWVIWFFVDEINVHAGEKERKVHVHTDENPIPRILNVIWSVGFLVFLGKNWR